MPTTLSDSDIVDTVNSSIKLFAGDTSFYLIIDNPEQAAATINNCLISLDEWSKDWLVSFNALQTGSIICRGDLHIFYRTHPI